MAWDLFDIFWCLVDLKLIWINKNQQRWTSLFQFSIIRMGKMPNNVIPLKEWNFSQTFVLFFVISRTLAKRKRLQNFWKMKCLKVKGYGWRTLCFGLGRIWEAFKRKDWIIDEWENVQLHEMKPSHTLSLLFYIYIPICTPNLFFVQKRENCIFNMLS